MTAPQKPLLQLQVENVFFREEMLFLNVFNTQEDERIIKINELTGSNIQQLKCSKSQLCYNKTF